MAPRPGPRRPRRRLDLGRGLPPDAPNDIYDTPARRKERAKLADSRPGGVRELTQAETTTVRYRRPVVDPTITIRVEIDGEPATITISATESRRISRHAAVQI